MVSLDHLTALYSPLDQEYNQAMSGPYEDLSYHGDDCKIIAGLKDGRISGFYRPVVALGDDKGLKLHIERLFDICPNIYYLDFLIDGRLSVISQFLLRHGHIARPYYTQIIELFKTKRRTGFAEEKRLYTGLRKSYKQLVKQGNPYHCPVEEGYMWKMKRFHEKMRGIRRSEKSWKIMADMHRTSDTILIGDENVYVFVVHNQYSAYYFSGVSDNVNMHAYIWKAIKALIGRGVNIFEMGEQVFDVGAPMMERGKLATKKDVDISHFKNGFGGRTVTRLILEK